MKIGTFENIFLKDISSSQSAFTKVYGKRSEGGKRKIKIALLEIAKDNIATNKNGLHWTEENVLNNLESLQGMCIAAEFLEDNRREPYGHGFTGYSKYTKEPLFEDSTVVGTIMKARIEQIKNADNELVKVLVGYGYVYPQRYPEFTSWLDEHLKDSNIWTSIEIVGKNDNDGKIVFNENNPTKEFRTPKEFDFSGCAILLPKVEQADDSALVLQLNNKSVNNTENKYRKEGEKMDNEIIKGFVGEIESSIKSYYDKSVELNEKITTLNDTIAGQNSTIEELKAQVETQKTEIETITAEKESKVSEINELNTKVSELNEKIIENEKAKCISELNQKLSGYSDKQKDYAKDEIAKFTENPIDSGVEINSIIEKIKAMSYDEMMAEKVKETQSEINCVVDIFGDIEDVDLDNNKVEDFGF